MGAHAARSISSFG